MKKSPQTKKLLPWENEQLTTLKKFLLFQQLPASHWPDIELIDRGSLPKPYDFLLTQEIMTTGISQYYHRSPKIRTPIHKQIENNIYYRAIVMVIDKVAERDNPDIADPLQETIAVELGLININLNVLPAQIIKELDHSSIPFGSLLKNHAVKIASSNQFPFKIQSISIFQEHLNKRDNPFFYGRTNILKDENNRWLANVVEILA
ncbi:MAG: hypothetical protein JSR33_02895 [Proteobacteria bacterium]|nr:hypothetical protein [Pseudomonadota bacterium]